MSTNLFSMNYGLRRIRKETTGLIIRYFPTICANNIHRDSLFDFPSKIYALKVKVKVTLEQATKSQRGSRGVALLFP